MARTAHPNFLAAGKLQGGASHKPRYYARFRRQKDRRPSIVIEGSTREEVIGLLNAHLEFCRNLGTKSEFEKYGVEIVER